MLSQAPPLFCVDKNELFALSSASSEEHSDSQEHGTDFVGPGCARMVLTAVFALAKRRPLAFAVAYGGVKTIAADAVVQKVLERREEFDRQRLLIFLSFGLFQVGFVQYKLYVDTFCKIFPNARAFTAAPLAVKMADTQGQVNVVKQVVLDQCFYHPLCYFPVFYTCQQVIMDRGPTLETVPRAISNYIPNAWEDLKALWQIFVPVSILQMSVIPPHLRVPFVATAGFVYNMILSSMRGMGHKAEEQLLAAKQKAKPARLQGAVSALSGARPPEAPATAGFQPTAECTCCKRQGECL